MIVLLSNIFKHKFHNYTRISYIHGLLKALNKKCNTKVKILAFCSEKYVCRQSPLNKKNINTNCKH
ncbi:hypothetical protein FWK35_00003222 [Aphis craccivora]|uniref:Uncharacterized protein n=1 Tax=Aphis craccivora TaxID=307492 RepID=A0A6G0ZME5_APHCR|nr:hypothetical protein FWK35_00003222 [Aphis craccivora]